MKKILLLPFIALLAYTFGFLYLENIPLISPNISLSPGGVFFSSTITNITILSMLVFAILILFITAKKKK